LKRVLTTWPFVLALTTLVVNDTWLKSAWPGFVTGKLSDFAGIAVVALLALQGYPQRRMLMFGVIAAAFAWWKSPWSQSFIDAVNSVSPILIARTVDFTDLWALLIMPACGAVARRPEDFALPGAALRRLIAAPIAVATLLGLMGTPAVTPLRGEYEVRTIGTEAPLDRTFIANQIAAVAKYNALACTDCADRLSHASFGRNFRLEYTFANDRSVRITVFAPAKGLIGNKYSGMADRVRKDLKRRLGPVDSDRIFIELNVR